MAEVIIENHGYVDLQNNGALGIDFSKGALSKEEIIQFFKWQVSHGVVKTFPTFISAPVENIKAGIESFVQVAEKDPVIDALLGGFHLECYVSREDGFRGAHKLEYVRRPTLEEIENLQEVAKGRIKIITLDPTPEPGREYEISNLVSAVSQKGILVSAGHTSASWHDIIKFEDSGGKMISHWGNGIPAFPNRHYNPAVSQIISTVLVPMVIVDGFHLPFDSNLWPLLLMVKRGYHFIIISDSSPAAGLPSGEHKLGDMKVFVQENGKAVLADNPDYLAGSTTVIPDEIANLVRFTQVDPLLNPCSIYHAMFIASALPAVLVGGVTGRKELSRFQVVNSWDADQTDLIVRNVYLDSQLVRF